MNATGETMRNVPNVLLIDDEKEFCQTLQKRLERRGIACESAITAMSGVTKIFEGNFDVIVLDMRLPDIGGLEVLRLIKACRPAVQVLMLSGHASATTGREGMEAGACEYLLKPVEFEVLVEKILSVHRINHLPMMRGSPA